MKMRMYWSYATRSLARGGQRSLLAIFCVAVGVMAIVGLQLVSNEISLGLTSNVRALTGGDLAITNTTTPLTASQLSAFDHLAAQGTITSYTAIDSTSGEIHLTAAQGTSHFFGVDAVNPAQFPLAGTVDFTTPSTATLGGLLQGNTVVITTTLAQNLNLRMGETIHLYTRDGRSTDVTIGGIVQPTGLLEGPVMLVNVSTYAALPGFGNQPITFDAIYADVPSHSDANASAAEKLIQLQFPLASIQTSAQALSANASQVQQIEYFLQVVALLALLIGGVGIVNTMQVLLRRRRVEIAMLKTAGYQRRDLYALFGTEAGLVGLVGGIVGTAAGVGASLLLRPLVENNLQAVLPMAVDPRTLVAGVAVGLVTAVIFGLLPIIQAGQVRPQAVLRELPQGVGWRGRVLTAALLALLVVLFFVLALGILRSATVALLAVGGAGIFLGALSLFFGVVVTLLSHLPVWEAFRWWQVPLVGLPLLIALVLTIAAPAFGILCLSVVVLGIVTLALPRPWKANVKLALRNLGRQKARTVTTLLALYIGVFAIGLILVLGQNISTAIDSFISSGNALNSEIIASGADRAAVAGQVAHLTNATHVSQVSFTQVAPVTVDGQPIGQFTQAALAGTSYTAADIAGVMNGVQGYDFTHGATLDTVDTPISGGRGLSAEDAGTLNALLPQAASTAPSNLRLGGTITVMSQADAHPITLTIVGFYDSRIPQFSPILTDSAAVSTLSAGNPQYGFRMHLDPKIADATLARIQAAVPGAVTYNFADFADQYASLLNNLITVLAAITSLAMLASLIIIANAVGLAMLERRRELGILKSVGHTSHSVLGEVLVENGILGFTSAFLALLVVVGAAAALGKLAFNLTMTVPLPTVLGVVAATVLVCMAMAAAVAWHATRVRPVEVLRYE